MTSVTRPRARSALISAVALLLVPGIAGCDSGDDIGGGEEGSPSDRATEDTQVTTVTTLQNVGNKLDEVRRLRVKHAVTAVVDPFFDGAFLGDFPRSDWSAAFAGFTRGAADDAQGDLDVLSNADIADQIETATATRRRVRVDVFALDGHPKGATAHFVLDFGTEGDLNATMRVRGDLYLAKDQGEWKIFGYDVGQAEQL
jgi:hypothetical protein